MSIKDYAKLVGVTPRTISNDIKAGRIKAGVIVGALRPVYDIDIMLFPPDDYQRRDAGRPKDSRNKAKE